MADDKTFDDAEKAYAAASAEVKTESKPDVPAKADAAPMPLKAEAPKAKAAAPVEAPKAATKAPAPKPIAVKAKPAKSKPAKAAPKKNKKPAATKRAAAKILPAPVRPAPVRAKPRKITRKTVSPKVAAKANFTVTELKEKIMTAKTTTDLSKPIVEAFGEYQNRAKAAYDKGTETLAEATDFAKGNVEALVESTKIFTAGVQDFSKGYVEEAKTAYETVSADVKELAAIKSPTELFQLQGKIVRRNFDAMVANSSKGTDAFLKLATEAFAPIKGRVTLAADKLSKVA
jgi:phasin family protein